MMTRIEQKFKELRKAGEKAFIAFITAGYPNLALTEKLILEFDKIGVDILELGVPFSDPMADGPVIQEASQAALHKKVTLAKILRLVRKVRPSTRMPICLMTYYNPIFCFGEEKFLQAAQSAGVDGVIIPDLTPQEGSGFIARAHTYNVNVILFIAPTTSEKRMKKIASLAQGFIYYVSLTGVTGARASLSPGLAMQLARIKKITAKPVCVGFGVSSPPQIRQICRVADGVIVGSAIVKKIKENISRPDICERVSRFVQRLMGVL